MSGLGRAAALAALAILGQAAALGLVDAPHYAVFQHYRTWSELAQRPPLAVWIVLAQAAVCLWCARGTWTALWRGVTRLAPLWQILAIACVLGFSLAVPTESVARFAGELVLAGAVSALSALNLVLAVRALPDEALERAARWLDARVSLLSVAEQPRRWDRALPWLVALWVLAICSVGALFVFEDLPHIDDDIVYLFQAKMLAAGRLWLPPPPDLDSFAMTHLVHDGARWYGKFFPGWPALLAVGVAAGAPWLVNPLFGALSVLCAHALTRRLYDRRLANAAALLLSASPWFLFLSASLMAHAASLFCMLLALLAIELQRGKRVGAWSLVAGVALGAMFLNRPFDAALFGPVAGLWGLGVTRARLSLGSLAAVALSAALVSSVMLGYDAALTGSALAAPHRLWADAIFGPGVDVMGFGPQVGIPMWRNVDPLPGHGLADVLLNLNKNFTLTSFELFGWSCGSLAFATLFVFAGRYRRADFLALATLLAIVGGHSFYWAPGGPDFGARYWYLISLPLVILTLRGADLACERWSADAAGAPRVRARVAAFFVLASVGAGCTMIPWRAVEKYHGYRDIGGELQTLADARGMHGAVVFVRSARKSDYQTAFSLNAVPLERSDNVFARDVGPAQRRAVVEHFAGRPVWVVGHASPDAERWSVLAGPLSPGSVPAGEAPASPAPLQAEIGAR